MLPFLFSPRDVIDSMRGFEPRRQGAIPCVETIPACGVISSRASLKIWCLSDVGGQFPPGRPNRRVGENRYSTIP